MIAELIERLKAAPTDFHTIAHAWTLDVIDELQEPMPLAIFVPGPINTEASPQLPLRQRQTMTVVVETICRWDQLDALRSQLYGALLGYQHTTAYTELEHTKGDVRAINGEIVRWMDMFSTQRWIQPTTP